MELTKLLNGDWIIVLQAFDNKDKVLIRMGSFGIFYALTFVLIRMNVIRGKIGLIKLLRCQEILDQLV